MIFTVISILFMVLGTAYSMYLDTLQVNVHVNMANLDTDIEDHRVYRCCCCCCHHYPDELVSTIDDNDTLLINYTSSCCPCHCLRTIWVGLLVRNNGDLPMKLEGVNITLTNGSSINLYFAYGPCTNPSLCPWLCIDPQNLPYPGYNSTVVIDYNETAVIWIKIVLTNTQNLDTIKITPWFTPWNKM